MRNLLYWIEKYNAEAGEQFELLPNATMWATHEQGIVTWEVVDGEFWMRHSSCIFSYWEPKIIELVHSMGFKYFLTTSTRNPKAYERLAKCKWIGDDQHGNHVFRREV